MEKLHLADLKAKEAKAKKAAENGEAGQAADTPKAKPIQRPLSKLDRELAAEKARAEAKEARRPLPPPPPPLHPPHTCYGPVLHHRAISESRSWCLACAEGGRAREEEGGASAEGRPAQEALVGLHALQRPSR